MKTRFRIPKKGWRSINIALVAATAWGVAGFLGDRMANSFGERPLSSSPATFLALSSPRSERDYSSILRGNIFNSAQSADDIEEVTSLSLTSGQRAGAPQSAIAATLRGTVVDSDPRYSRATVTLNNTKKEVVLKEQDDLLGSTVLTIERNRLYLSRNGRTEVLDVPFGKFSSSPTSVRRGGGGVQSGADVTKAGEGEYLVSRRYIDAQLASMNKLITEVRAVPNIGKDGVTDGFRLFSIKKGSLFDKIGFQNRDVVKRINGINLDSAEKGLELFSALRSESNFEVDIERNKAKQSLRFAIQ